MIGLAFQISLTARQSGTLAVSGEFMVEQIDFPTFNADVQTDGSIRFPSVAVVDEVRAAVDWNINSTENGRATGTIVEIYSIPGLVEGEVRFESRLTEFRTGAAAQSSDLPVTSHRGTKRNGRLPAGRR